MLWRHCHDTHECEVHTSSAASLVIIGDAFHTFVDGAVIAAAVITSVPLGITTALAVAAHEIPQEVGDVAILLRAGFSQAARVHAEPAVGRRRHPRRGRDARRVAVRSPTCCPTSCRSRPATSSTSRWPTSSPTCTAAASAAARSASSCSSSPASPRSRCSSAGCSPWRCHSRGALPLDSPTRSLARRFVGAFRLRASVRARPAKPWRRRADRGSPTVDLSPRDCPLRVSPASVLLTQFLRFSV